MLNTLMFALIPNKTVCVLQDRGELCRRPGWGAQRWERVWDWSSQRSNATRHCGHIETRRRCHGGSDGEPVPCGDFWETSQIQLRTEERRRGQAREIPAQNPPLTLPKPRPDARPPHWSVWESVRYARLTPIYSRLWHCRAEGLTARRSGSEQTIHQALWRNGLNTEGSKNLWVAPDVSLLYTLIASQKLP